MAKAAETLTPINLELGGNDAMIVCSDADLYRAANGAIWAGFLMQGNLVVVWRGYMLKRVCMINL